MIRKILGGSTATLTAATLGGYLWARSTMGEDAVARIITYDKVAVPAILEYKLLEYKL